MVADSELEATAGAAEAGQPSELQANAEAVRAYLVSVRGGAPFLSSLDARLLRAWLEAGVRVGLVARAIDAVNRKRLAQRVRAPLALASCRAEVERLRRHPGGAAVRPRRRPAPGAVAPERGLQAAGEPADGAAPAPGEGPAETALEALPVPPAVAEQFAAARARVSATTGSPEARLDAACALAREFFDGAWDLLDRPAWIAAAAADLADNRALYAEGEWAAVCEAWAREALRRRYAALTATRLWEELACGVD